MPLVVALYRYLVNSVTPKVIIGVHGTPTSGFCEQPLVQGETWCLE